MEAHESLTQDFLVEKDQGMRRKEENKQVLPLGLLGARTSTESEAKNIQLS